MLEEFVTDEVNKATVNQILEGQKALVEKWNMKSRLDDITRQIVAIPNATVGKPYSANLDPRKMGWEDFVIAELIGLEGSGLNYSLEKNNITGIPVTSGEFKLTFKFRLKDERETNELHEKGIILIINPDPKTLWKNKPGKKDDIYWKEENVAVSAPLGDKHIVVVSKRGRSHANVGSFRDDDFSFQYYEKTGWSVVTVADGAGSAWLSRKGSQVATQTIVDFFESDFSIEVSTEFDDTLRAYKTVGGEEAQKKLSHFISDHLSKAAWTVHQCLASLSKESGHELKDFHTTLIFTLFKKYEFGYAFLSFGVGDCPIALINKEETEVTLMNWLDVGEYGGGNKVHYYARNFYFR